MASQKKPQKKSPTAQAAKVNAPLAGRLRPGSPLRRAIWFVILIILALIIGGIVWQAIAAQNESRRNPAPGKLVEVGTGKEAHKLHIYCLGKGSPTVVFEAGIPEWSIHWRTVQEGVAKFTRACAYDRAGYGWSEPGPGPRTAAQIAKELHELLANAGEQGPYVLAVHSMLGPEAMLYAKTYPDEVAGLVLAEAWSPQMLSPVPPFIESSQKMADSLARLAPYGLLRSASRSGVLPLETLLKGNLLPPDLQPVFRNEVLDQKMWNAVSDEYKAFNESASQLTKLDDLGDLPLVIVKAGNRTPDEYPPAETWDRVQAGLAKLSSRGRLEVAPGSGTFVQLEAPASVVQAIHEVVEEAKNGEVELLPTL